MTKILGHSDHLITLSLSLSLSLSGTRLYIREVASPFVLRAVHPRQYTAFPGANQEKPACSFVPAGRLRRGRRQTQSNFIHNKIKL